jgi:hypothetical protein
MGEKHGKTAKFPFFTPLKQLQKTDWFLPFTVQYRLLKGTIINTQDR